MLPTIKPCQPIRQRGSWGAYWNTAYLDRAIQVLNEEGISVPEEYLAHISPLGWEHITITGTYHWKGVDRPWGRFQSLNRDAVDEMSQSQAEYTTMAFRSVPGAIVVGSTTAGADGNVSPIPMPGGLRAMISGLGVFYPDKRPTQRVGITADREIKPTIAGIRAGRDEVLEAGIREIVGAHATAETIQSMARHEH